MGRTPPIALMLCACLSTGSCLPEWPPPGLDDDTSADDDDTTTYPLAGHFVDFLRDGWGVDTLKTLHVAENLDDAFAAELGLSTGEVEAAWLATIE
ncbi:MAG: hypothetical protein QGH45_08605 [Myxococcota bacterium]|jgi:hypothetical protein|nr:hypothetical protein [Myxococcota bacterium]